MWDHHHKGFPLSISNITSAGGSASGVFVYSFIAQVQGFRAVFWPMMATTGIYFLLLCTVLRETRQSVLLRRRVEKFRKETGNIDLDALEEMRTQIMRKLLRVPLVRPFHFLVTEPVIIFYVAFNGYLFGLTFLFNGAFTLVFCPMGYGFNTILVGLANL
jgi:hypothetical protein